MNRNTSFSRGGGWIVPENLRPLCAKHNFQNPTKACLPQSLLTWDSVEVCSSKTESECSLT